MLHDEGVEVEVLQTVLVFGDRDLGVEEFLIAQEWGAHDEVTAEEVDERADEEQPNEERALCDNLVLGYDVDADDDAAGLEDSKEALVEGVEGGGVDLLRELDEEDDVLAGDSEVTVRVVGAEVEEANEEDVKEVKEDGLD